MASAFARKTYGGNVSQYLGDVVVQNRNFVFGNSVKNLSWTNMNVYSYHTYGKTGLSIANDIDYLKSSVNIDTRDTPTISIPVIVTEYNAHTAADWDKLVTTPDDFSEASRLASEIISIVKSNVTSHYVFKFSVTSDSTGAIKKNGIHWADIYGDPYHVSDSTTCAEALRLLTQLKNSKVYPLAVNDSSTYRTYLGSSSNDGFYYLYIVNDAVDTVNLSVNLAQWNITAGTQIIMESVSAGYFGEIQSVLTAPVVGGQLLFG